MEEDTMTEPGTPDLELAGITELADAFGVNRTTVYGWRRRPGFPAPLADLRAGPVFDLAAVRAWKETRDALPFDVRYRGGGGVPPGAIANADTEPKASDNTDQA